MGFKLYETYLQENNRRCKYRPDAHQMNEDVDGIIVVWCIEYELFL